MFVFTRSLISYRFRTMSVLIRQASWRMNISEKFPILTIYFLNGSDAPSTINGRNQYKTESSSDSSKVGRDVLHTENEDSELIWYWDADQGIFESCSVSLNNAPQSFLKQLNISVIIDILKVVQCHSFWNL